MVGTLEVSNGPLALVGVMRGCPGDIIMTSSFHSRTAVTARSNVGHLGRCTAERMCPKSAEHVRVVLTISWFYGRVSWIGAASELDVYCKYCWHNQLMRCECESWRDLCGRLSTGTCGGDSRIHEAEAPRGLHVCCPINATTPTYCILIRISIPRFLKPNYIFRDHGDLYNWICLSEQLVCCLPRRL